LSQLSDPTRELLQPQRSGCPRRFGWHDTGSLNLRRTEEGQATPYTHLGGLREGGLTHKQDLSRLIAVFRELAFRRHQAFVRNDEARVTGCENGLETDAFRRKLERPPCKTQEELGVPAAHDDQLMVGSGCHVEYV
jgi:hypothetical protein